MRTVFREYRFVEYQMVFESAITSYADRFCYMKFNESQYSWGTVESFGRTKKIYIAAVTIH